MYYDITCSLVTYKNDKAMVSAAIKSFLDTNLNVYLYIIDNSPTDELRMLVTDPRAGYIHNPSNPGFGAAHNIAIKNISEKSLYHLVLNPDIFFGNGVLSVLMEYCNKNPDVGVCLPKVLYPNGNIQYLAKLLPTPIDFFTRRLMPVKAIKEKHNVKFELRKSNYDHIMEAPYLSGCFLFFRTSVLKEINGFDENFFMHMEDLDICRRVIKNGHKTIFFPLVSVFHAHEKKSMGNLKNLKIYLKSAIYYFNKWGWFFDDERANINAKVEAQINTSN